MSKKKKTRKRKKKSQTTGMTISTRPIVTTVSIFVVRFLDITEIINRIIFLACLQANHNPVLLTVNLTLNKAVATFTARHKNSLAAIFTARCKYSHGP